MSPNDEPQGEPTPEEPQERGHEHLDVDPARVFRWAGLLGAGTLFVVLVVAAGYAALEGIGFGEVFRPETEEVEVPRPPEPRLEEDPYANLRETRSRVRERLQGWSWIDREAGTARIPIDRAMEMVAERYRTGADPPWPRGDGATQPPPPGPRGRDPTGDEEPSGEAEGEEADVDTEAPRPSVDQESESTDEPGSDEQEGEPDQGGADGRRDGDDSSDEETGEGTSQ